MRTTSLPFNGPTFFSHRSNQSNNSNRLYAQSTRRDLHNQPSFQTTTSNSLTSTFENNLPPSFPLENSQVDAATQSGANYDSLTLQQDSSSGLRLKKYKVEPNLLKNHAIENFRLKKHTVGELPLKKYTYKEFSLKKYPSESTEDVIGRQIAALRQAEEKFDLITYGQKRDVWGYYSNGYIGVPKKVKEAVRRASIALRKQGKFISNKAFDHDVRIRISSMYSEEGGTPWVWKTYFQMLFQCKATDNLEAWDPPPGVDSGTQQLLDAFTQGETEESRSRFRKLWDAYGETAKSRQWPRLALLILRHHPALMPDFLLSTNYEPYPPFSMVSDCMLYLHYFHQGIDPAARKKALLKCMDPERWPVILVPQRGVRLYVMYAGLQNAYRAMHIMGSMDSQVSVYTLLAFMNVCTQAKDVDRALACLRTIAAMEDKQGLSMRSEPIVRHCCKLLQLDEVVEEDGIRNFRILPQVLKLGVSPSVEMMNVVLSNAFATGDSNLGLDMIDYMKGQSMEFSCYTYVILLGDAVSRRDQRRADELLHEISLRPELRDNRYIASKVFHTHYVFGAKDAYRSDNPSRHFSDLMNVYCRYFDPAPLKELGIVPDRFTPVDVPQDAVPSNIILMIMIAAYLRCNPRHTATMRVYKRFRELVAKRHPVIAPLVEVPAVYNEFIISFRPFGSDLSECVSIVEDMMRDEPFELEGTTIRPARPNNYTWNTLMSVFVSHRDSDGVASVREIMRESGVDFDLVTWNTIINHTVRNQDTSETVAAMKEMDEQGIAPNKHTIKALRLARDPERLQAAIDALDQETEELVAEEMKGIERENEALLDKGLKRLSVAVGRQWPMN